MIDASGIRAALPPLLSFALLAAVGVSLVASPGADGLFGAFLFEAVEAFELLFLVFQTLDDAVHGGGHEGVGIFRARRVHDHAGVFFARILKKSPNEIENYTDDAEK